MGHVPIHAGLDAVKVQALEAISSGCFDGGVDEVLSVVGRGDEGREC